jgi:hypothetical protein
MFRAHDGNGKNSDGSLECQVYNHAKFYWYFELTICAKWIDHQRKISQKPSTERTLYQELSRRPLEHVLNLTRLELMRRRRGQAGKLPTFRSSQQ